MNRTPLIILLLVIASLSSAPAATIYWDTNGGTGGVGGTGTWLNGGGNWSLDTAGTSPTTWDNANLDFADFRGTAGTVTVSGEVIAGRLNFNVGGYTLEGDGLTVARASGTGSFFIVTQSAATDANTVSNNITIADEGVVAGAATYSFSNSTAAALIIDGDVDLSYSSPASGLKSYTILGISTLPGGSGITLNGTFGAGPDTSTTQLAFGNNAAQSGQYLATYTVNGNNSALNAAISGVIHKGTVHVGHGSALGAGSVQLGSGNTGGGIGSLISYGAALLTNSAITVANNINLGNAANQSILRLGGNTADTSTFSGTITINNTNARPLHVSAVSGGRVNFSGEMTDGSGNNSVVKDDAGVVAFTNAAGNTYKGGTTVSAGTLLLMNTSGSATGTGTVTVEAGATLGGTGIATGAVTASSATSAFAPGDLNSIGVLRLTGGLTAGDGATFNYDINGASIDGLDFGGGSLTLGGVLTFDFSSLGPVDAGTSYSLFSGTGSWSGTATFVFNAPSGYLLDTGYGGGNGYIWDAAGHSLTVQFAPVPEPSAAALAIVGGLAFILWRRRSRK